MKSFEYTVKDELGIHARPAGLMMLMSLGVKQGDTVTVSAEGADEDTAIAELKAFFENNL